MRKAAFAEMVLSLVATRERAATIAGDLVEGAAGRDSWFWRSLATTAIALFWRSGLAYLLTGFIAALMIWGFNQSAKAPHGVGRIGTLFGWCATLLLMTAVRSALRYGLHDMVTLLSAVLGLAASCGVWFRWVAPVPLICGAAAVCIVSFSVMTKDGRKALGIVSAVIVLSGIGGFLILGLLAGAVAGKCNQTWLGWIATLVFLGAQALLISIVLDRAKSSITLDSVVRLRKRTI